jgi:hypothetical protein
VGGGGVQRRVRLFSSLQFRLKLDNSDGRALSMKFLMRLRSEMVGWLGNPRCTLVTMVTRLS